MFQFETRAAPTMASASAAIVPPQRSVPLSRRAFLSWAEHCVECAPPSCYGTCDLYRATPALKCRRFDDGIVPVRTPGARPAAEIRFRRWAKLEAQGSARMLPVRQVDRIETLLGAAEAPVQHAGALAHRVLRDARWLTAGEVLYKRVSKRIDRAKGTERPDVFLADITNPGRAPIDLTLTVYVDRKRMAVDLGSDQLPPPVSIAFAVPPGRSLAELDAAAMHTILESGLPFNLSIAPSADAGAHLIFHALDLGVRDRGVSACADAVAGGDVQAKPGKIVVFDLDNTLWKGILLEGEVAPLAGLADLFETLDRRGILISIASKNAPEDALSRLRKEGLADYLLYPQIGWLPKSEGIARIVKTLNIGADSVVFVDDNPFEREEVRSRVPGVEVLPETAIATLLDHPRLQGSTTSEAQGRRKMYQEAVAREEAQTSYGDDYLEFLKACGIRLEIRDVRPDDMERVAELVTRTNQLNFSGRKYTRDACVALVSDTTREKYVLICSDRYGSYGTVGFALVGRQACDDGEELLVEDFMLSCRVQGKFIEQAFLFHVAERVGRPVDRIRINFRRTERNGAAQLVLDKLGFVAGEDGGYVRPYAPGDFDVDFLTLVGEAPEAATETPDDGGVQCRSMAG